jgi:hypothetical protein
MDSVRNSELTSSAKAIRLSSTIKSLSTSCAYSSNKRPSSLHAPVLICSWELGTGSQVLLELNAPFYSVLSPNPLPPSQLLQLNISDAVNTVLCIAHSVVLNHTTALSQNATTDTTTPAN